VFDGRARWSQNASDGRTELISWRTRTSCACPRHTTLGARQLPRAPRRAGAPSPARRRKAKTSPPGSRTSFICTYTRLAALGRKRRYITSGLCRQRLGASACLARPAAPPPPNVLRCTNCASAGEAVPSAAAPPVERLPVRAPGCGGEALAQRPRAPGLSRQAADYATDLTRHAWQPAGTLEAVRVARPSTKCT
jgi:hypothetical protein